MKYYFWILGCAMNYSDAERISAVLESLGYSKTEKESEADLFIVISCSVRQSAINRIYGKIKDLNNIKAQNPKFKTLLSGCVLKQDKKKLAKVFDVIFEIKDLNKLPELLGHKSLAMSGEYLANKPSYDSKFRAYVPISTGCDNFCSYCAVPYTRGREISRPQEQIITEVLELIGSGYKEITLLGQNVNSYGHDITGNKNDNQPFIDLLLELDKIAGDHRIYFYSNHPKDMTDALIATLANLKHFPHYIHLPLQSGNDEIIRKMNRHYTKENYLDLVSKIRKIMPDITLTTDIIVGFPGETEEQFNDTLEVMKIAKYDMAFIAQYSPRSGTVSAKWDDDVTESEKKTREKILQKVLAKTVLESNQKLLNTNLPVLVDGEKAGKFYGRTAGYKVVEIKTDQPLEIGQYINVKIDRVESWKLFGQIS
jgi:tRNA-2-methylthio-N6-dimethylallyladenosine synthase